MSLLSLLKLEIEMFEGCAFSQQIHSHAKKVRKGTFNKYVRMKIGLFDPPSPLVRKMTSLLLHSLIY